ncbi:hypothetical protein GCM10011379_56200 [Filimonas zeae]|uniref:Carboxypeptidase-like regulatory domain-containing protein n=2 Tax=Filimonas zeae TaxID=1737353 RepID=A0A917J4F1_9BACT|nr:hypothetical protein GCM10011379_56200 [Filimonas zeae]
MLSGHVTTIYGAPLAGVQVNVVGYNLQTYTDGQGFYLFTNVPAAATKLFFNFIGYYPYEYLLNPFSHIYNLEMEWYTDEEWIFGSKKNNLVN